MKILPYRKSSKGVTIVESAATLVVFLPLLLLLLFAVLEASYAYVIRTSLAQAAERAARDLSIAYGQDPTISTNRGQQDSQVFDKIRITNMVNSSQQFDNPVFDASANPPTVAVTVKYLSNQFGLPTFPNPDPLNLGSSFQISASSIYRLE